MLSVEPPLPSFLRSSNVCAAAPVPSSARIHTADAKIFMGSLHKRAVLGPAGDRLTRPVAGENNAFAATVESLEAGNAVDCRPTVGALCGQNARPETAHSEIRLGKRLIEPPRDLVAQGCELRRRVRRARPRDRYIGDNPCRTHR